MWFLIFHHSNLKSMRFNFFYFIAFFILLLFVVCKNEPNNLRKITELDIYYPIEVNLCIDTIERFGPFLPGFGPNFILSVKNIGPENVIFYEVQNKDSKNSFAYINPLQYLSGDIYKVVDCSDLKPIGELFGFISKKDTIEANKEYIYMFDPRVGQVFRDSVSFVLMSLPIESHYFDSLNNSMPFVYHIQYPKNHRKEFFTITDIELKHPFYVFSTQDSLNIINVTGAFINNKIIARKE